MLKITIPDIELYDEETNSFFNSKEQTLTFEHSLVSLSKWESKWHKPFTSREEKTIEQTIDYIRCMTLTQNVDEKVYTVIQKGAQEIIEQVNAYIEDDMTATKIPNQTTRGVNRETVTSELIYYWMVELNIPFECQKWHLNRLLTLINVCNIKKTPPKKMGAKKLASRNSTLNASRRAALGTRG